MSTGKILPRPRSLHRKIDLPEALDAGLEVLDDLVGQEIGIRQVVQVGEAAILEPDDPRKFMIEMTVTGGCPDLKESTAYFRMVVEGFFEVLEGWPAEQVDKLVRYNAPAVLWGACRELLLNLSFRSETGPALLPCVNFLDGDPAAPPATPAKPPRKNAAGGRKKAKPG